MQRYTEITACFLAYRCAGAQTDGLALVELSPGELDAFLLAESTRLSSQSLRGVVTALRSLLRFLAVKGLAAPGLAEALPSGPGWRRTSHGRVLDGEEVARLLAGCDRRRAAGRRDYAMLVLMVRLGLRANEVAALCLGDIDWRNAEILVAGKGGRDERLPLPVDVGRALADYCRRGRPRRAGRALFLHARAPYQPLSRTGVGEVVRRACRRAGLRPVGAHRLRHTAATAMRRGGAPLGEIAQVLRHRDHATTAIYVNVAAEELRALAREWPGAVACTPPTGSAMHVSSTCRSVARWASSSATTATCWPIRRLPATSWSDHHRAGARLGHPISRRAAIPLPGQAVDRARASRATCTRVTRPMTCRPATCWPIAPRYSLPRQYSGEQISALVAAAGSLDVPLRAASYRTLFGLLAVTGLRVGEALRLDRDDVELDRGLLVVRDSKFGKSRTLPLAASTVQALERYRLKRDQLCPRPSDPAFFLATAGTRTIYSSARRMFVRLLARCVWSRARAMVHARMHDLRHSWAIATLVDCYRQDLDVAARMPLLSGYLGHSGPESSWWYLHATPELLWLAGERLERALGELG